MSSYQPLNQLTVKKSNRLVNAKYMSTLLENQIMSIALTRIEAVAGDNGNAELTAKLYPGELKKLVSDPTHIYRDLKVVSKSLTGHSVLIEDGLGNFKSMAIVTNADYIGKVLTVKFNAELKAQILGLERNYTTLQLSMLTSFKNNASFRLYELLKSEIYRSRPSVNGGMVEAEYNISELKFMLGLANLDSPFAQKELSHTAEADWDDLYSRLDKRDKKYERWAEFQRNVLKPAQDELKEKSNIRFEYEGIREGRKMNRILFFIYPNTPAESSEINEKKKILDERVRDGRQREIPFDTFPDIYDEYIGHNGLTRDDIDLLLEKASLDEEKVRSAIKMADEKGREIRNYMGWLVRAIENDYAEVGVLSGSAEKHEKYSEILKDINDNKEKYAANFLARIMKKDDYPEFLAMMFDNFGIDEKALTAIYEPDEITGFYIKWKNGEAIEI